MSNFTIYRSSAGSGKTFTLVKEYLALALNDPSEHPQAYKHILAVTFTNKAAAEMKDRIIRALKELCSDDYSHVSSGTATLIAILKKHPALNAATPLTDEILRRRAKKVLSSILHNYSDFAIGTIDAFVHKVVRTFAFDLRIPMSFDVEMDDDKLLSQAIDLLISNIGNDEKLTKALVEFTESKTDNEKSWHIENDLKAFAKNLLNEEGSFYTEKLRHLSVDDFTGIRETIQKYLKDFETNFRDIAGKAVAVTRKAGIDNSMFYRGSTGIGAWFEKLADGDGDKLAPNSYVVETIEQDKWYGGKASPSDRSAIDSVKPALTEAYRKINELRENHYPDYLVFNLINRNIYSLAVLNEIEKVITEYKNENNVLHISEFNKMISTIVLSEPIPFIYERLGEKYNNYLIDEFQDTSVLQFQNLLPLIDNSLANGYFTMLVGDGKQAIYRWRGGEVEQFASLPSVFGHKDNPLVLEREDALKRNFNPQVLNRNFRSKREIIEFNNSFFRCLSSKLSEKYRGIYDQLEQEFDPANSGGLVSIEFIRKDRDDFREENMSRTAEIIRDTVKDGFQLKDIAVLVRRNSDGSELANYLTSQGIPVVSPDSLLLSNSVEVNFLYSLLKYISAPENNIVQAEIIHFLIAGKLVDIPSLNELISVRHQDFAGDVLRKFFPDFDVLKLSKMSLYELAEELVKIFRLNASPDAYIQFFLDEVLNYMTKKNNILDDFIEFWEDRRSKASLVIPQGLDAVSIMTVHRSKGLEFPVVIMPFANSRLTNGKEDLWITLSHELLPALPAALVPVNKSLSETAYAHLYEDECSKSLLDHMNVLYVGLTRAEQRMHILTGKPSRNTSAFATISDMFADYLQQQGRWNDQENIYRFGEGTAAAHRKRGPSETYTLKAFNSNRWRESIRMRAAAPGIWNTEMAEVKKDYGVLVHSALARILTAGDTEPALESMLAEGLITREEREELESGIRQIIGLPAIAPWFREGLLIRNEAEIVLANAEIFRPDRVVIENNNVVIIDYKTGSERNEHKKQIRGYGEIMKTMGYEIRQMLLVYIGEKKVVTVSDDSIAGTLF